MFFNSVVYVLKFSNGLTMSYYNPPHSYQKGVVGIMIMSNSVLR